MKLYTTFLLMFLLSFPAFAQRNAESSVTLNWDRPTEYTDGAPLNRRDISGYTLYYGFKSGLYHQTLTINKSANKIILRDLPPGMYYFAITADLYDGRSSDLSNEVIREVFGSTNGGPKLK